MIATTPKKIAGPVRVFCREVNSGQEHVFVPVVPAPYSVMDQCFENVQLKIENDGGDIAYGWQIWLWENVFIEAEHHGVWKAPDGALVDVTPKRNVQRQIVFLPDPAKRYDYENHRRIDNVRKPLVRDQDVSDFLAIAREIHELMERGSEGAGLFVTVDPRELSALQRRHSELHAKLISKYIKGNDMCPCKSGKKYKKCCGRV